MSRPGCVRNGGSVRGTARGARNRRSLRGDRALDSVELHARRGPDLRAHRSQRRGQDDDVQRHQPHLPADSRAHHVRRSRPARRTARHDLPPRDLPDVPEPGALAGLDRAGERDGRRPPQGKRQLRHRAARVRPAAREDREMAIAGVRDPRRARPRPRSRSSGGRAAVRHDEAHRARPGARRRAPPADARRTGVRADPRRGGRPRAARSPPSATATT